MPPACGDYAKMATSVIVVVLSTVIVLLILYYRHSTKARKTRASNSQIVPGPPRRRFTGHLLDLLEPAYHRKLHEWAKTYGNIYRIDVLGIQGLVVSCPKVISQLLGQERGTPDLPKLNAYHELDLVRLTCCNRIVKPDADA